jgi:hypothetical protein
MPTRHIFTTENFFCDGPGYVLTSSSLGGSGLSHDEIAHRLESSDPEIIHELLSRGICLPLYFPADCALNNAVVILGDLNEREQNEWIGRIQAMLEIPCGELVLLGGGMEEDFDNALSNDPNSITSLYQTFKVPPGRYLVEIYAFLGSITADRALIDVQNRGDSVVEWCQLANQQPENYPQWLQYFLEDKWFDWNALGAQEYIIRLAPLQEHPTIPELTEDMWCGVFTIRTPKACPQGIFRSDYV